MKFIETCQGEFINIEDISRIDQCSDDKYLSTGSYISLKNGVQIEFLEVPSEFQDDNGFTHVFDTNHIISWHRHVINVMLRKDYHILSLDELQDESWDEFIKEYQDKSGKFLVHE